MARKITRPAKVGILTVGGTSPVSVQTMWDKPIGAVDNNFIILLEELKTSGCDIIRFSVPSEGDIQQLADICKLGIMPVVADIHFDYKLALKSIHAGVDKIRINPGNIGAEWKVREVIKAAAASGCAVRIGLNGGSLPHNMRGSKDKAASMCELAGDYIDLFQSESFTNIIVSLKDSDAEITYRVNKLFSETFDYPLHLGVTEAGPLIPSVTKSAFILGRLLSEGIGDTLRISITGSILDEVRAGVELLKLLNLRTEGLKLISCPKCGRSSFDTHWFVNMMEPYFRTIHADVTVAVMGCAVNGPGEAAHADIGITGIGREVFIFRKGSIVRKSSTASCTEDFKEEMQKVINEKTDH
ncbi:MAG: flavodoxin-dependent (E)-4-hydroxy-3-methylbut-2-enyl-diphosphate synthase [Spirochaetia bacterium]|nr:flavodoxin-dependent (E)-4-hydroxy-3-methylbut-2-enyl-diphosphate synthase [Spirochaetia bacterium]